MVALPSTSPEEAQAQRPERDGARLGVFLEALPDLLAHIAEGAAERDATRTLPFDAFALLRRSGLAALRIPEADGGAGASVGELLEIIARLAAADSNVAHALRSHYNFVETVLLAPPGPLRQARLQQVVAGQLFGGAHTETGTPRPGDLRSRLVARDGRHVLDGHKYYSTGTAFADWVFTTALDEAGAPVGLLLPLDRAGIRVEDDWDGMGQRLTASGSVVFEGVDVRPEEIERRESIELDDSTGRHTATFRQLYLAACQAGIARNIVTDAVAYVREKARPITHSLAERARDDAFVQRVVGGLSAHSFAIDAILAKAAAAIDSAHAAILANDPNLTAHLDASSIAVARAQAVIGQLGLAAATSLFDVGGGSATSRTLNFDRHWRNMRTLLSHNPTDYKLKVAGDYLLNGTSPPLSGGFF